MINAEGGRKKYNESKDRTFYGVHKYNLKSNLGVSKIDRETVLELENESNIPIQGPKYCPFGLGYRRCAGENFVYFLWNDY